VSVSVLAAYIIYFFVVSLFSSLMKGLCIGRLCRLLTRVGIRLLCNLRI
jgi:hypothetical protein